MNNTYDILSNLPAEKHIRNGLTDLKNGTTSIASCLVRIASPRLVKAGLLSSAPAPEEQDPELTLYHLLQEHGNRAYSRYNSLLRELVSFERALDHRLKQQLKI